ncbi:MAG: hypothetical protein ABIN99_03745 [Nitrosospira sp.]
MVYRGCGGHTAIHEVDAENPEISIQAIRNRARGYEVTREAKTDKAGNQSNYPKEQTKETCKAD